MSKRQNKTARTNVAVVGPHNAQVTTGTGVTEGSRSDIHSIREKEQGSNIAPMRTALNNTAHHVSASVHAEHIIRRRAYELYERRGRIDGHAEEDWLRAEAEVLGTVFRRANVG
jgi:hypothetical protein